MHDRAQYMCDCCVRPLVRSKESGTSRCRKVDIDDNDAILLAKRVRERSRSVRNEMLWAVLTIWFKSLECWGALWGLRVPGVGRWTKKDRIPFPLATPPYWRLVVVDTRVSSCANVILIQSGVRTVHPSNLGSLMQAKRCCCCAWAKQASYRIQICV